jgi:glyoxylase-like metal-dependent hydrolase (beta-lactamase superfamily II)
MVNIKRFMCNPLQENCYVVSDDTKECVIIDCGAFFPDEKSALTDYVRENSLKPVHLIATHGHLDHNFGNAHIFSEFGLKVEVCKEDDFLIEHLMKQAKELFGIDIENCEAEVGRWLKDGDTITFGNHTLKVMQTPGHTPGSALLYCEAEHTCFTGDTLFRMSIGRTDFDGGSWQEMEQSLKNIVAKLPKETIVLSGHGPQSTIADELMYNPYLRS